MSGFGEVNSKWVLVEREKQMPFDSLPLTNDVVKKLEEMHSLLSTNEGWIQKHLHRKNGYCLLGAAREVSLSRHELADALGYKRISSIVRYNDHPRRTQSEVLARLRKAINKEREKILLG